MNNRTTLLKEYADILKKSGFEVYMPDNENPTYFKFVKENKIGYAEYSQWGWNFSTVHKPNGICGTGYGMHREKADPTVEMAFDCFVDRPSWASSKDPVIKYSSWEEYQKKETILKYVKY